MEMLKKSKILLIVFFFLPLVFGASPGQMKASEKIRDPFKSPLFIQPKIKKSVTTVPLSPLLKFALSELKLVGIVWGSLGRVAIVEAPDGKCYSIKKGDMIGKFSGKVKKVYQDNLVVQDEITDYAGKTKTQEITIKLYKEEKQKY